jgi:hypothetical protein
MEVTTWRLRDARQVTDESFQVDFWHMMTYYKYLAAVQFFLEPTFPILHNDTIHVITCCGRIWGYEGLEMFV